MATDNSAAASAAADEQNLVLTRVLDAPREQVFAAWTEPAQMMRWFEPAENTMSECHIDLRIGGRMLYCMRTPAGQDFWCGGVYTEIMPPEKLAYTEIFADAEGKVISPAEFGMPEGWPTGAQVTLKLEDIGGKTRLTADSGVSVALSKLVGSDQGWSQILDKLAEYVKAA